MTKTITVVCDTTNGVIYGSIKEARDAYFTEIGEINGESHEYACKYIEDEFYFEELVSAIVTDNHNVLNIIKTDYYDYISEQNEASFKEWLNNRCIVSDVEVEV